MTEEFIGVREMLGDSLYNMLYNVRLTDTRIVRCRDCRCAEEVTWPVWACIPEDFLDCHGKLVETWDYRSDEPMMNPVEPDGYCAWGERREK